MVKKTTIDTSGDPYSRMDAMDITCGICQQDIDPNRRKNFIVKKGRPFHVGCVESLRDELEEANDSIKLDSE